MSSRTPLALRSAARELAAGDDAIWKRLEEAGFDEESVRRKDKAALIAYITKLESEVHDYQHHMGLLILEKKELTSKFDQAKASSVSVEFAYKRDLAAKSTALAEARKREESLKKALAIEKECVENMDKALHDMRAVSAETKVTYESKLIEARAMVESSQKKFDEAELKLHAAESLHAEASRFNDAASRNLQDAKAREDDIRRRMTDFESECETKEHEIRMQRQSLHEGQNLMRQEQERLLESQSLLNQREEYILERSKELSHFEKEIGQIKAKLEDERRILKEEKSNLDCEKAALGTREEDLLRREYMLDKKECEVLLLQEKIASREQEEIQRLKDENQHALEEKLKELEAEVIQRHLSVEQDITAKALACEAKEADLIGRVNEVQEREMALDRRLCSLVEKEDELSKLSKLLGEKEQSLHSTQKSVEMDLVKLQQERDEIQIKKLDLEKIMGLLEEQKAGILHAQENLKLTESERNEIHLLESSLKEEIDSFRAQKSELMAEADKLKADKEKFEMDWELLDEKREELKKEAERVDEERKAVNKYLKDELECIKLEKEGLRNQYRENVESLSREREEFMSKMEHEHSDWFNKIQQEREDFARDIMIQRKELESCIEKKREEIETYQREKEEALEQERALQLEAINLEKEKIVKDMEHVAAELGRLHNERTEIAVDRKKRETEWAEINTSIKSLDDQRQKLQKQRELLHVDRDEIYKQIQKLEKLEDSNIESENRALSQLQTRPSNSSIWKVPIKRCSSMDASANIIEDKEKIVAAGSITPDHISRANGQSPPAAGTISWIRKVIFRRSPGKLDTDCEAKFENKIMTSIQEVSVGNGLISKTPSEMKGRESAGRKRLNNMLFEDDAENILGPHQKHYKTTRQKIVTEVKETTSNW